MLCDFRGTASGPSCAWTSTAVVSLLVLFLALLSLLSLLAVVLFAVVLFAVSCAWPSAVFSVVIYVFSIHCCKHTKMLFLMRHFCVYIYIYIYIRSFFLCMAFHCGLLAMRPVRPVARNSISISISINISIIRNVLRSSSILAIFYPPLK